METELASTYETVSFLHGTSIAEHLFALLFSKYGAHAENFLICMK